LKPSAYGPASVDELFNIVCNRGRNGVRWRPGQEASLAPHVRSWGL